MKKSRTDKQWVYWGDRNPYFGVLGWETREVADEDTKEQFFRTGRVHIDNVLNYAESVFGKLQQTRSAVDFGCGVGRLLPPLAEKFDSVIGIDIAPQMLEQARVNTAAYPNIEFVNYADEVPGELDFLHSHIVFQHIRPSQGMQLMDSLISKLAIGGIFSLHFTIGDSRRWRFWLNWLRYRLLPLHILYNLVRGRPLSEPITEMNAYNIHDVLSLAASHGVTGAFALHSGHNGHRGITLIGKKSAIGVKGLA